MTGVQRYGRWRALAADVKEAPETAEAGMHRAMCGEIVKFYRGPIIAVGVRMPVDRVRLSAVRQCEAEAEQWEDLWNTGG